MMDARKKSAKIEKYFIVITVFIFFVIAAKYYIYSGSSGSLVTNFEKKNIINDNEEFFEHQIVKKNPIINNYFLEYNIDGEWELKNDSGKAIDGFRVEPYNEMLVINKINLNKYGYSINIDSIRTYHSNSHKIYTDIPYEYNDKKTVFIPEQEDYFPIFGYHNVVARKEDMRDSSLDIMVDDFEKQIQLYSFVLNCNWITLGDLAENYILMDKKIPSDTCLINFDDGRKNNYEVAKPILDRYNVTATFYIIYGRLDERSYMTKKQVSELYLSGHEIGSHTFNGGGLVNADWFDREFTKDDLAFQVAGSNERFKADFYDTRTFAYPLGEWNDVIIQAVKDAGYIAARDTRKSDLSRDRRALATSMQDDYIWHFNYYKPEMRYDNEIEEEVGYNGWWQFEEGNLITNDGNNNSMTTFNVAFDDRTHGLVILKDTGDTNENKFILKNDGDYKMELLIANNREIENEIDSYDLYIDGKPVEKYEDANNLCTIKDEYKLCSHYIDVQLGSGSHIIKVVNKGYNLILDRFRISRKAQAQRVYNVTITEY